VIFLLTQPLEFDPSPRTKLRSALKVIAPR
jgi:hypothetical protein